MHIAQMRPMLQLIVPYLTGQFVGILTNKRIKNKQIGVPAFYTTTL